MTHPVPPVTAPLPARAGWRGQAADGFAQGWRQWQTGAHEVIDGPESMA